MPGDKAADGIQNLFELDKSSLGQPLSHAVDGSLSLLVKQWVGKQRHSIEPLNIHLGNFGAQPLDSLSGNCGGPANVPYNANYSSTAHFPGNDRSLPRNQQLNVNGSWFENKNFQSKQNQSGLLGECTGYDQHNLILRGSSILKSQQEYESGVDSPTLTTNSERSEITEVSTDLSFLIGKQQFEKAQQLFIPQPFPMQQSGYTDMQTLQQQHMIFKQLQDLQRQQQLQQFGEAQQQNQLSTMSKQAPLNGMPVNDASQMFMNWVHCGASPAAQVGNRVVFPTEQGQSLNGTPFAPARGNNMGQYSQVQGIPQPQKCVMQTSGFNYPLSRDQFTASPGESATPQGALLSNQGLLGKNIFGQVPNQSLSGVSFGNFHEGSSPQTNASLREFNRQEQTSWSLQQNPKQHDHSQDLVPLDPIEEKLLYNMDDTVWDVSSDKRPDIGASSFGNTLENIDATNSFPSMQSGSWSALMQSAVGEASSSETGLQEEWSGLTFQNTEQSTDNHLSNFMENDNQQQTSWIDSSLQTASSLSSKPLNMFNDSSMTSFPGFQQPGLQFSVEQRGGVHHDGSRGSVEKSSKVTGQWIDCKIQQKSSIQGSQQVQPIMHLNNAWPDQVCEGQQVSEIDRSDNLGKGPQQLSNGPRVFHNSCDGGEAYEKQNSYYHKESTNTRNNFNEVSNSEQGRTGQFQLLGDASSNTVSLEQGRLTRLQGNSKASNELPSRGDVNSMRSDGSTVAAQARADLSSERGNMGHFGSTQYSSFTNVPEAEILRAAAQLHKSPVSQSFGLRLSSPSQRFQNSGPSLSSHASPQPVNYPNTRQVNSELPPRAPWDDNTPAAGDAGSSSYLNMQGNSGSTFTPGIPYLRSQPHVQLLSSTPIVSQSPQATLPSMSSRFPHLHATTADDNSRPKFINPVGQQFPVLESVPVSQPSVVSGVSEQGDLSARPHNVWTNVPIQRQLSVLESPKINIPSSNNMYNSPKASYGSSEFGHDSQQQISSEIHSASQRAGFSHGHNLSPNHISETNVLPSRSMTTHFNQQDHGVSNDDNVPTASGRNPLLLGHAPHSSSHLSGNYSLLQQVQAMRMKQVETDPSKRVGEQFNDGDSKSRNSVGSNWNSNLKTNLLQSTEASEDQNNKVMSQPEPLEPSHEAVKFGQYESQSQTGTHNLVSGPTEHGLMNLPLVSQWMKQYGTLRNGQILPMYNAHLATVARQLTLGKPSQNLQIQASLERANAAETGQIPSVMPSTLVTSVEAAQFAVPYVLPSDGANRSTSATSLKKRKSLMSDLPWHKEVTEGSKRLHAISMAEQDWSQATNRIIEKVEDQVDIMENVKPVVRSKRRFILTTQLMQQLLRPALAPVLAADATKNYGSITYLIAKVALGDACSLTYCTRNNLLLSSDNSNMIFDKLATSEGVGGGKQLSEVVEELTNRAMKLEDDLLRLDKSASLVDVRVECQDLERFSIINRFAKFHIRGQADTVGSSSSSGPPKLFPQKYVTANPMPRNVPEGFECASL